ncbi:LMBR1 domain-containing protein [Plasmodium yoelii yoelii]|uniref:LMBR1 domain-containing protein n=1 Tax=Plasmodium yoelii yoelii TaxID=73239 RepID=A0AAF0B6S1_PLAYO|nr:LMBR1 domain-containing protein [Plasmodium yoelii yoelii]
MDEYILLIFFIGCLILAGITGFRLLIICGHKNDNKIFVHKIMNFIIIIGYMICWILVLLFPIDIYFKLSTNVKKYLNIFIVYRILYLICLSYIFILTPILIIIYLNVNNNFQICDQNNLINIENEEMFKKKTIEENYKMKENCFFLFFLTYLPFKKIKIKLNANDCKLWYQYILDTNKKYFLKYNIKKIEECQNIPTDMNIKMNINLNVNDHIILFTFLFGFILFSFYLGIGMFTFPFNLIYLYKNKKRKIKNNQLKDELTIINIKAKKLIQITEILEKNKIQIKKMNFFKSFYYHIKYIRQKKILNYIVHRLEKDYQNILDSYNNPNNQIYAFGYLLFGLIFLLLTISIIVHLIFYNIFNAIIEHNFLFSIYVFWDSLLQYLIINDYIVCSIIVYTLIVSYLLICALSGYIYFSTKLKLGLAFMLEKKNTYINFLLLHVCLFMVLSSGAVVFSAKLFRTYFTHTHALILFDLYLKNLGFIGELYKREILTYLTLTLNLLTVSLYFIPKKWSLLSLSTFFKPWELSQIQYEEVDLENNHLQKS